MSLMKKLLEDSYSRAMWRRGTVLPRSGGVLGKGRAAGVGGDWSIALTGDQVLQAKLSTLRATVQRQIIQSAQRKSATRIRKRIVQKLSGNPVGIHTGNLRRWFQSQRRTVKAGRRSRNFVQMVIEMPTREFLGIGSHKQQKARRAAMGLPTRGWNSSYYPAAVEYGTSKLPARSYIRSSTDEEGLRGLTADMRREFGRQIRKLRAGAYKPAYARFHRKAA